MSENASPAFLIAVGGFSGSGKSTLSRALAALIPKMTPVERVSADRVRKELWGVPATEKLPQEAYSAEFSQKTYNEVDRRIGDALAKGKTVIVDAGFLTEFGRASAEQTANAHKARFVGLWCEADTATLHSRVDARQGDESDATREIVDFQKTFNLGAINWHRLDASRSPSVVVQQALRVLNP